MSNLFPVRKKHLFLSSSLFCLAIFQYSPLLAQSLDSAKIEYMSKPKSGVTKYLPDYFKQYSPTNAAQMVSQIPGFNIENGAEVRGLAGSEGNVLIDGSRPSLKGQDLFSYLSSIPAASVKSIETLEGEALGNLGGGHTILVNVIRDSNVKPSGSIELGIFSWGDIVQPNFEAKYNWQVGEFKYAASASTGTNQKERRTGREILWNRNGTIIEQGPNNELQNFRANGLDLTIDGKIKDTKTHLTLSYGDTKFDRDWNYLAYAPNDAFIREDLGHDFFIDKTYNIGASAEKTFGKYEALLNLSATSGTNDSKYSFGKKIPSLPADFGLFASNSRSLEAVAQFSLSRKFPKHSLSFGGETGYNKLDSKSQFYNGDGMTFVLEPDSLAHTIVSETRSEAFLADNFTASPKLSIEGKLRVEWSRISQKGDKQRDRSFVYLKPRIALNYKLSDNLKLNASFERKLGQLDFNDFAYQVSLVEGNNTAANDHLVPNKNDNLNFEIEKKWGKNGNITFGLYSSQIHNAIALIPVIENGIVIGETIGNVDDAKKHTISISTKIPLNKMLDGLELNIDYRTARSEILDPFTMQKREYFSQGDNNFEANLTWNLEKQKQEYGVFFFRGERNVDYRFDGQYLWPNLNYWGFWGQFKNIKDYEISFEVHVPNGFKVKRHRTQYEVSRFDGLIATSQYKEREIGPRLQFSIKKMI